MLLPVALFAGIALSACAREDDAPSEAQILKQAEHLVKPDVGRYVSTTELVDYAMPGASPQEADKMAVRMKAISAQIRSFCLGEAEAEEGFAAMWRSSQEGDCIFQTFEADSRRMKARMVCKADRGVTSVVSMAGTGTGQRSSMLLDIRQESADFPGGQVLMKMQISNERVGDC